MEATVDAILKNLKTMCSKDPVAVAKVRQVPADQILGVSTRDIRTFAKSVGKNSALAEALWRTPYLETKALAILLIEPKTVSSELIDKWVHEIADWSTCDLFVKTVMVPCPDAVDWVVKWARQTKLYVKRAGLALMANLSLRAKTFDADTASTFCAIIEDAANDPRDHVRQATCWALREFGKSNSESHERACLIALNLIESEDPARVWVGRCAYRELEILIKVPERRRLISRHSKTARKYVDPIESKSD
jgi:3-methyladenine DNA glycosylase AlkD